MATPVDVAQWMLLQLNKSQGTLYQEEAADGIAQMFGENFLYENQNGNRAINKQVLDAFRELTSKTVVWERGERAWRFREEFDPPGRTVDY